MRKFLVGGAVRDKMTGKPVKDFDYSVVLPVGSYRDPFEFMCEELEAEGFKIFVRTPEHLTVRAQFPVGEGGWTEGMNLAGGAINAGKKRLTADFVLARKEGVYTDGRRPDHVSVGTLEDDLKRRDFTMNAMALDEDGNLIDLFGGQADIERGIIRAVGDPRERMYEDPLRALRALRFCIQLEFDIEDYLAMVMCTRHLANKLRESVADERIADELNKMLRIDTLRTLNVLRQFPALQEVVFSGKVSLEATMKTKGRK